MVKSFIAPTYCLLERENGLRDNPGTVDDFFRLNNRFLQRAPMPYLQVHELFYFIVATLLTISFRMEFLRFNLKAVEKST